MSNTLAQIFSNPLNVDSLRELLEILLTIAVYILFPIIVLMIVYTGFLFVQAQGKPDKIQEARRMLMWTIIGGLIVLGAYALSVGIAATVAEITP